MGNCVYLEVEDDCPNKAEDDGGSSVDHITGVDIHEFDLKGQKSV